MKYYGDCKSPTSGETFVCKKRTALPLRELYKQKSPLYPDEEKPFYTMGESKTFKNLMAELKKGNKIIKKIKLERETSEDTKYFSATIYGKDVKFNITRESSSDEGELTEIINLDPGDLSDDDYDRIYKYIEENSEDIWGENETY